MLFYRLSQSFNSSCSPKLKNYIYRMKHFKQTGKDWQRTNFDYFYLLVILLLKGTSVLQKPEDEAASELTPATRQASTILKG